MWITVAALLWLATSVSGVCPESKKMAEKYQYLKEHPVKWSTVIRKVPLNAIDALSIGYAQPFTTFLSGLIEVTEEHVENKEDPNVPEKATINCMDYYYNLTDKKLDALKEQGAKTQQDIEIMKGNIEEIKKNVAEIKEIIERDVLPAIQDLQDVVTVKFKDMSKKLHDAVNEVKVYQTAKSWYEAFIKPIQHLRLDMGSLLQSFLDKNLVRAALRSMNETCWKHTPLNIATDVKSLTGAGCTSDVTMALLQDRNSEPESQAFADLCVIHTYVTYAKYSHASADNVLTLINHALLELILNHYTCVGLMYYKDQEMIEFKNKQFLETITSTANAVAKLGKDAGEAYWLEPMMTYAESLMDGPDAVKNARGLMNSLNERYSWYNHQVFLIEVWDEGEVDRCTIHGTPAELFTVAEGHYVRGKRIYVTRYRNQTQKDMDDFEERYRKFVSWLEGPTEFDADKWATCNETQTMVENGTISVEEELERVFGFGNEKTKYCRVTEEEKKLWVPNHAIEIIDKYNGGFTSDDRDDEMIILNSHGYKPITVTYFCFPDTLPNRGFFRVYGGLDHGVALILAM